MALPLKQLELILENKSSIIINHRHKLISSSKVKLNQLNFHRSNNTKQTKSNSASSKDKNIEKIQLRYASPKNQEGIVMMISSLTNPQTLQLSPIKKYILYKQKEPQSQKIQKLDNEQHKLRINSIKMKIQEEFHTYNKISEQSNERKAILQTQASNALLKRSQLSANLRMLKNRVKSYAQDKRIINIQSQSKMLQKIKLPQLKQQKQYPMIMKQPDQLKHIRSESFILIQYPSERIVVTQKANLSLQIASLTKIMTFYTIIQIASSHGISLDRQYLKITKNVQNISGTSAQLIQDQEYSIQQLLYGLMLPSGNDAANELAYWGGNRLQNNNDYKIRMKTFIGQMNRLAKVLNLKNTKFGNPHGLPHADGRSTSFDIAKLCCICMKIDLFRNIVSCRAFKCCVSDGKNKRNVEWQNTNKLLRREGFLGLKTGITVTAGPCLAAAYQFKDKIYISVILRAPKISSRFRQTRQLIYWALTKLYKQSMNQHEKLILKRLKRSNPQLDSDYSEDEHEFRYDKGGSTQFKKRVKILKYQL